MRKKNKHEDYYLNPIRRVRLIDGGVQNVHKNNIVGFCSYEMHRGFLTVKHFKEHQCEEKRCNYFYKTKESRFWLEKEKKEKERAERKQQAKKQRELQRKRETFQNELRNYAENFVLYHHYPITIVGTRFIEPRRFSINYVSPYSYNDWSRYVNLGKAVARKFHIKVVLTHVRDMEKNYVTVKEYKTKYKNSKERR